MKLTKNEQQTLANAIIEVMLNGNKSDKNNIRTIFYDYEYSLIKNCLTSEVKDNKILKDKMFDIIIDLLDERDIIEKHVFKVLDAATLITNTNVYTECAQKIVLRYAKAVAPDMINFIENFINMDCDLSTDIIEYIDHHK